MEGIIWSLTLLPLAVLKIILYHITWMGETILSLGVVKKMLFAFAVLKLEGD